MDAKERTEARRLAGLMLGSLDEARSADDLAGDAYWSPSHFYRLFRVLLEERPGEMRRRLLLERAAWQLGRTDLPVTGIALEAHYGSLEAFTRAFRKAFGVSPSLYRRLGASHYWLPARNGIHFAASRSPQKGASDMDLFDRFAGADSWHTRRMLEAARSLTDDQLDRPLDAPMKLLPWEKPEGSLRDLLDRIVFTKEVWTAALGGRELLPSPDRSVPGMLARFDAVDAEFNRFLREVRDAGRWDDTFVDALCEPPETFTFGGMFAHLVTFNTHRRLAALALMRRYGVSDLGFGCPMEYESSVAPWRSDG
jgi:AraC family transcriptional regulator